MVKSADCLFVRMQGYGDKAGWMSSAPVRSGCKDPRHQIAHRDRQIRCAIVFQTVDHLPVTAFIRCCRQDLSQMIRQMFAGAATRRIPCKIAAPWAGIPITDGLLPALHAPGAKAVECLGTGGKAPAEPAAFQTGIYQRSTLPKEFMDPQHRHHSIHHARALKAHPPHSANGSLLQYTARPVLLARTGLYDLSNPLII